MRAISLALILSMIAGVHDVALLAQRVTPESIYLLPYGTLLLFACLLFAVQRRYVGAINATEQLSDSLAQRLDERERTLKAQHARLVTIERQRLMRDMHDGLGSALTSSLVLVEQGRLQAKEVANVLRECVDDLRLVIDSLEPIDNDLVALLATLRYRLGRRLEHAGLELEWAVQETLTNILKHADAHRIRIETLVLKKAGLPDQVCVHIEDDGKGFDMGKGTRVTLLLPVNLTPVLMPG